MDERTHSKATETEAEANKVSTKDIFGGQAGLKYYKTAETRGRGKDVTATAEERTHLKATKKVAVANKESTRETL
jgi:hypothetical protein